MRTLTAAMVGVVAGLILMAGTIDVAEYLPPCPTEDSDGCYWDADTMGDGNGNDVVTR